MLETIKLSQCVRVLAWSILLLIETRMHLPRKCRVATLDQGNDLVDNTLKSYRLEINRVLLKIFDLNALVCVLCQFNGKKITR